MNHGIETTYNGTRFRSRLEARWAAFFDLVGWKWTYEPFDLAGYIPDFVLQFHEPLLVEVKPELSIAGLEQHAGKLEGSGWEKEALIVGADPRLDGEWRDTGAIGLLAERWVSESRVEFTWEEAPWSTCLHCHRPSFFHASGGWKCRVCGEYDGDHMIGPAPANLAALWGSAHALTRWVPRGGGR